LIPIILSGGSGTRLWPLSRKMYPKQFLSLLHEETMLQKTLARLDGLKHQNPVIVCNEEHRFIVAEQVRQLGIKDPTIILEPFGKNTAPAIAVAAIHALQQQNDPTLLILSADHEIQDESAFRDSVTSAQELTEDNKLVTFAIVPTSPATGYGYIKRGAVVNTGYTVECFVEKPDSATAGEYLTSQNYYWNSGMFMFKASAYLAELGKFKPEILQHCQDAAHDMVVDFGFKRLNSKAFGACESISVDYAVMEKTDQALVVPMDAGWSDIGSWNELWEQGDKDQNGNAIKGDVIVNHTSDTYIYADSRLVTAIGMKDVVIVETKDAVLVADKTRAQDVKHIVENLVRHDRPEKDFHRVVYRPWGNFDSVDEGDRYKVKRITVNPGARLSLQKHKHRAEHWVVVSGTAKVYRNDEEFTLSENESIFIPLGHIHSLENPGDAPLEIIEVQSGSYLGEDDIVRFEDKYGREESQ